MNMPKATPKEKANRVVITNVMTIKLIVRLIARMLRQLSPLLLEESVSANFRRATSSLLLSSSMVMHDGDGLRLCASSVYRLGRMVSLLRPVREYLYPGGLPRYHREYLNVLLRLGGYSAVPHYM